jgi:hypothetical protein
LAKNREAPSKSNVSNSWYFFCPAYLNKVFLGFFVMYVLYSTLLHLPPLRFHCVGGCWDRTQDSCDFGIGFQMLCHAAYISSTLDYISSTLGDISSTLGYISSSLGYISSTLGYISSTFWIHAKHKLIRTIRCRLPQFLTATLSMVHKIERKKLTKG